MMIFLAGCMLPGLGPEAGMRWDDLPSAGTTDLAPARMSDPAALAGRWWVIVASDRTAPAPPVGLGTTPILMPTSGFSNLMPCWKVLVAGTYTTEAEALKDRDALRARKIDAYAKFAGEWREDPEIAAYCSRLDHPPANRVTLVSTDGGTTLPVELPQATIDALAPLTTLASASDRAWSAPLGIQNAGGRTLGDPVELLDVVSGERRTCRIDGFGLQALGYSAAAESCGPAAVAATLDCELSGDAWIVTTAATRVWTRSADVDLSRYSWPKGPPNRTLQAWTDGTQVRWLAEAWEELDGPCGGDEVRWWAWVDPGTGKRLGPQVDAPFSTLIGVVDVDGGEPELLRTEAFGDVSLWASDAELGRRHYNLCLCPC